jgi:hypothetical protein
VTPDPPPHPLPALTTYELTRYRHDLEHCLASITDTPARARLHAKLAEVDAEQESRARLRRAGGR